MQPLIGITCEAGFDGKDQPYYHLRHNYCRNLTEAGASVVLIPHDKKAVDNYVKILDGILISGGDFDVPPKYYGDSSLHPKTDINEARSDFELALAKAAMTKDVPLLGICGGAQLLTVAAGGGLHQHLKDDLSGSLEHEQPTPRYRPYHEIAVRPDSVLAKIIGKTEMKVNSAHHQGIKFGGRAKVVATATDSVAEAVEIPDHRFYLGLQWHPEYNTDPGDEKIFAAFVAAAR